MLLNLRMPSNKAKDTNPLIELSLAILQPVEELRQFQHRHVRKRLRVRGRTSMPGGNITKNRLGDDHQKP